jgi:hypothetical protein
LPVRLKDEFVAVVQKALAVNGLVVADREIVGEAGPPSRQRLLDGNRLDPVNDVLQFEVRPDGLGDIESGPRVLWFRADVQKERAVFGQSAPGRLDPRRGPLQILRPRTAVVIGAIPDTEVVGRGGDEGVDRAGAEGIQGFNGVAVEETQPGPAALEFGVRFGRAGHSDDCTALTQPFCVSAPDEICLSRTLWQSTC